MDPSSWSAYSQHFSRLGATMNAPPGPLTQSSQLNDLTLSSPLPRQDHIGTYGNTSGTHHFLLATSHGLNASQTPSRPDPSFNTSSLFAANYDASLLSASFQSPNKGHISSFPQSSGLFKAVNRENDFTDLRTGFAHCGVAAYARNPDGNNAISGGSGISSSTFFPNSMTASSWRHSGIIPPTCGPFGVLPHETVLQRSHLVGRGSDKLGVQVSKSPRSSLPSNSFVEQDLSRGYRGILSSPARPPSSFMDSNHVTHSSLLSPQSDPYFSSVTDSYYSSCSKTDFGAYSSYCSNVQPPVQRSAISPYCYTQSFGAFDSSIEKQDSSSAPSTNVSANTTFANFVPNTPLNGNHTHLQNGQVPRQTVITSNTSNNSSVIYNSQTHPVHQNPPYNQRESYPYAPNSSHPVASLPSHSGNSSNSNGSNASRQTMTHMNNNHHMSLGQTLYPPMSTPIPASTPAHPTPPSSMGQAYVPAPLVMNHESACSSVNSQPMMYNSPSNDACYSTPGTCPSDSGSPAKQDMSQHSSPSVYSIDNSDLSMNSAPFMDPNRIQSHSSAEGNYVVGIVSDTMTTAMNDSTNDSTSKLLEDNLPVIDSDLMPPNCNQQKEMHLSSMLPLDMAKVKAGSFENIQMSSIFEGQGIDIHIPGISNISQNHSKGNTPVQRPRTHCAGSNKCDVFVFSSDSPPPVIDYTRKVKIKGKRGRKKKCDVDSAVSVNCVYPSHLHSSIPHPLISTESDKDKTTVTQHAVVRTNSPVQNKFHGVQDVSSLPVDLSHVSLNLSTHKQDISMSNSEVTNSSSDLPELSYESPVLTSNHWQMSSAKANSDDIRVGQNSSCDQSKDLKIKVTKRNIKQVCETSTMDDLSDESKTKLCNSIEDDLGFLAELSSASDADDGVSKGSLSEKKVSKGQGFLQSFLTFLEVSEEPSETSNSVRRKTEGSDTTETKKLEDSEASVKSNESEKDWILTKESSDTVTEDKSENEKKGDLEQDDKDNFDETPSLDPTLFGSTLQKEMVVPNPEAPSFSSDEDENSTQGIFDSVAMAIQRLCEENEEEGRDKAENIPSTQEDCNKNKLTTVSNVNEGDVNSNNLQIEVESIEKLNGSKENITIVTTKRRKGRRRRKKKKYICVVKMNDPEKQILLSSESAHQCQAKVKSTKISPISRNENVGICVRRTLMRKCKEHVMKKRDKNKKRKQRICVKRTHIYKEQENKESSINLRASLHEQIEVKEITEQESLTPVVPSDELPKKLRRVSRKRQKRKKNNRYLVHRKKSFSSQDNSERVQKVCNKHINEIGAQFDLSNENIDAKKKFKSMNNGENNWNTEIHFKTGDYVTSIDSKDSDLPPVWRIEGKNVLQLFEAFEGENKVLYRNTSSYSRWSPSSKHKYARLTVKVIKSDDETVIVETLKDSVETNKNETKGPSVEEYTVHPQRENFEVYLQTLVSHALDPDFIPEIIKENDEYFLSHLQAIEKFTTEKKETLLIGDKWNVQLLKYAEMYPYVSVSMSKDGEKKSCEVCDSNKIQYCVYFHGQLYDLSTLEHKAEVKGHPVCDWQFSLCGSCVQTVTLYSRLHHHKYHFFQQGCKKVKDVKRGEKKESHAILEECLQDAKWMTQMFQEMVEMWNACDKFR